MEKQYVRTSCCRCPWASNNQAAKILVTPLHCFKKTNPSVANETICKMVLIKEKVGTCIPGAVRDF